MKTNYSARAITLMSYETRQKMYEQEKDELFRNAHKYSTEELARKHDKIIKKWRI